MAKVWKDLPADKGLRPQDTRIANIGDDVWKDLPADKGLRRIFVWVKHHKYSVWKDLPADKGLRRYSFIQLIMGECLKRPPCW